METVFADALRDMPSVSKTDSVVSKDEIIAELQQELVHERAKVTELEEKVHRLTMQIYESGGDVIDFE
jgi:predicted RNase H-like nuclease (RuvC/YqgF family)